MLIFTGQMLQNHILEPHFVNNPLLAPKWDHHTAASKLFFTDFGPCDKNNIPWRKKNPLPPNVLRARWLPPPASSRAPPCSAKSGPGHTACWRAAKPYAGGRRSA